MENEQYLEMFIQETNEHIQNLNQSMLELEKDPENADTINEIFRAAHTIKGMAGTMGFSNMQKLTHQLENVFDLVRNHRIKVDGNLTDLCYDCIDYIDSTVKSITDGGTDDISIPEDIAKALDKYAKIENGGSAAAAVIKPAENKDQDIKCELNEYQKEVINSAKEKGFNAYQINVELAETCVLKYARAYVVFKYLQESGEVIYSNPSTQDIEKEKFDRTFTAVVVTKENKETIEKNIINIAEIKNVNISVVSEDTNQVSDTKKPDTQAAAKAPAKKAGDSNKKVMTQSIRVDVNRLDQFMNLVSELIIIKNHIEDVASNVDNHEITDSIEPLERLSGELHDAVMKVRMVPVQMVFDRFPRVMRDLAKQTGKKIDFIVQGAETEVDRTVIDEIGDPLIHLLRNSVDHGVELPEERKKLGKPEKGKVELIAYHDGNNVAIEVTDDGGGINTDKVGKKAVEKGLITEEQLSGMNESQIIDLLFMPGFSTSDKVTNISGRGVGLDVVKTKIESLGGTIQVDTAINKGSRFLILLPLTLSIIRALIFKAGEEIYAFPLNMIKEIITTDKSKIKTVGDRKVLSYRDDFINIACLSDILHIDKSSLNDDSMTVLIVKKGKSLVAFVIDDVIAQQSVVLKSMGKYLNSLKSISGATILGNGRVVLILDPNHLI